MYWAFIRGITRLGFLVGIVGLGLGNPGQFENNFPNVPQMSRFHSRLQNLDNMNRTRAIDM